MLFSVHRSPKNIFLKIALCDLDLILTSHEVRNAFPVHRSSKMHFLKICTWWPLELYVSPQPPFQTQGSHFQVSQLYLSQNYWNFEVSRDFSLQVDVWPCKHSCNCTCICHKVVPLVSVLMLHLLCFYYIDYYINIEFQGAAAVSLQTLGLNQ